LWIAETPARMPGTNACATRQRFEVER